MKPNKKLFQLRMTAGRWRGRKIIFPKTNAIRPTTDRIRETVFNWLCPYLKGARCLDAFAGSGILGFEALSRNAAHITFIDQAKINTQFILTNARNLQTEHSIQTYTQDFFSTHIQTQPFDIIFLDPPYHKQLICKALTYLEENQWIDNHTIIYIEGEKAFIHSIPESFNIVKQKSTQTIEFALLQTKK